MHGVHGWLAMRGGIFFYVRQGKKRYFLVDREIEEAPVPGRHAKYLVLYLHLVPGTRQVKHYEKIKNTKLFSKLLEQTSNIDVSCLIKAHECFKSYATCAKTVRVCVL